MRISAILPTRHRPALTQEAVESVLSQSRPPDEVIVVDDGSADGTAHALARFGKDLTIIRQEHAGVSAARNAGIRAARGEWIAFLDSDDLWLPGKLRGQEDALTRPENADYRVAYTNEKWIRDGTQRNQGHRHAKHTGWIYVRCLPLCIISPSSVIMRRDVFDEVGLFDEELPACEDYDMWLRLSARFPVLYLPEKLVVKRAGDWPRLSAAHSLDRYRILALRKALDSEWLPAEHRSPTMEMLREKVRVYALGCRKHGRDDEAVWAEARLG